jgi:hypothetical protein
VVRRVGVKRVQFGHSLIGMREISMFSPRGFGRCPGRTGGFVARSDVPPGVDMTDGSRKAAGAQWGYCGPHGFLGDSAPLRESL